MTKKNLPGICFYGCGHIANQHVKNIKSLYKDIPLFFASQTAEEAENFSKAHGGSKFFASCEEAAASDEYQIAFITTPHAYHAEMGILAAKNGKDLILEKPVTRNSKELKSLMKEVDRAGVRCTVAENYLYKPFIQRIRRYIEEGLIGEVLFIELNKTNRDTISGWRSDPELMGGGALLEGGCHWVNQLVSLAGSEPTGAFAIKPDVPYETTVPFEDTIMVAVEFSNGTKGKLTHSWRIPNPLKGMGHSKIYGTEGVITFESNGIYTSLRGKKRRFAFTNFFDFLGFKAMHRAFIEDYINDRPWDPSMERITGELKLIEAAYRSLKSKKLEKII